MKDVYFDESVEGFSAGVREVYESNSLDFDVTDEGIDVRRWR